MQTRALLFMGPPGVGETSALLSVAAMRKRMGVPAAGFVTEEMQEGGARVGFRIRSLEGESAILARIGGKSRHRVER